MSVSFAVREARARKEAGNAAFAAGKYRAAIEAYTEAIVGGVRAQPLAPAISCL